MSNVTVLHPTNTRDIPSTLRTIADGLEEGDYGDITAGVLTLAGKGIFENFAFGKDYSIQTAAALYLASANRMSDHVRAAGTGGRSDIPDDEDPDGVA